MKWLKVFSVFIILHAVLWVCAHFYKSVNPNRVIVGVDTSFAMTSHFPAMQTWIANYENQARYESITVVTDKEVIGILSDLSSLDAIFRSSFGLSDESDFAQYQNLESSTRYLLSDGRFSAPNWTLVRFD